MRKYSLIAASISLAISGSAFASLDDAADMAGNPVEATITMSGASAPTNMLRENVIRNVCDNALPINVYVDAIKGTGGVAAALPLLEHTTYWSVECTGAASATGLAGTHLAVVKSDAGGSGNGTTPVADSVALTFQEADKVKCTDTGIDKAIQNSTGTFSIYTCGGTSANIVNQIPDGGTSDIEPTMFTGSLAPSSGDFVNNGNLTVRTGPGLIFGVAITKAFRNELQADQGLTVGAEDEANMPSLPSTYVRSLTEGRIATWAAERVYGNTLTVPTTYAGADGILGTADDVAANSLRSFVHICRRVQGSGTHAQYMTHFHRTNCQDGSLSMPSQPGLTGGNPAVFENSSSGDLGLCLDALDQATALTNPTPDITAGRGSFAIGYQATEKNQSNSENWRFIKVDGVAPTRENVYNGDYDDVYFLSFQNRNDDSYVAGGIRTAAVDAAEIAAVNAFYANHLNIDQTVADDINQGFQFSWGGAGFVIPSAAANTDFATDDPLIPWSRESAGGAPESCQPLNLEK